MSAPISSQHPMQGTSQTCSPGTPSLSGCPPPPTRVNPSHDEHDDCERDAV